MSGIQTYVINSSFPDATNPSLARVGLRATVGIGNMDLVIPYIRKATSELLNVPISNVGVEMIAHHYHCYNWCRSGKGYDAPHFLKVYAGQHDITDRLGTAKASWPSCPSAPCVRPGARAVPGRFILRQEHHGPS